MAGLNAIIAKISCFLAVCLLFSVKGATLPEWTWIGGSNTIDQLSSQTAPGARRESTGWVDSDAGLWLFGGEGKGFERSRKSTPYVTLDDLWRFNIKTQSWSLIPANEQQDVNMNPPPLSQSVVCSHGKHAVMFGGLHSDDTISTDTWIFDTISFKWSLVNTTSLHPEVRESPSVWCNEDMWIFGGSNKTHYYNDMWKFSFVKRQWQKQVIKGKAPSQRKGALAWFVPNNFGTFYLFGGWSNQKFLSDLWAYNMTDNKWDKIQNGSFNTPGTYGTLGVSSIQNHPGSRFGSGTWTDFNGNLWLFGGTGYFDSNNHLDSGYLSDLWMLDTNRIVWSWMGGETLGEMAPRYPSKPGERNSTNLPGPRSNAVSYNSGEELWLFGGEGHDINTNDGILNDLWKLDLHLIGEDAEKPQHPLSGNTLKLSLTTRIAISVSILFAVFAFTLLVCYKRENRRSKIMDKNVGPKYKYERVNDSLQDMNIQTTA